MTATVRDRDGAILGGSPIQWASSDPTIATVDSTGLVAAIRNGEARISAVSGAASGFANVLVQQVTALVSVTPASDTLFSAGDSIRLTAIAKDRGGSLTGQESFTWASSDETIVTVSPVGVARAAGPNGQATITATAGLVSGSARITVVTDARGGTVIAEQGRVTLEVPAGAVSDAVQITVTPTGGISGLDHVPGSAFALGPDGTRFSQPVRLTINFDPSRIPTGFPESQLRLNHLIDGAWTEVPGSVLNTVQHTAAGNIHSFSSFAVGVPRPGVTVFDKDPTDPSSLPQFSIIANVGPVTTSFAGQTWSLYIGTAIWRHPTSQPPNQIAVTVNCSLARAVCTSDPARPNRLFIGEFVAGDLFRYFNADGFTNANCSGGKGIVRASGLGHELGHFVQQALGLTPPSPSDAQASADWEAQAQCIGARIDQQCGPVTALTESLLRCALSTVNFDPTFVQLAHGRTPSSGGEPADSGSKVRARIVFPPRDALVRADVPIFGIADGPGFDRYTVEYGDGVAPVHWRPLASDSIPTNDLAGSTGLYSGSDHSVHGNLATWDVGLRHYAYLPTHPRNKATDLKGTHIVRLIVTGRHGEVVEDRVPVFVADLLTNAWGGTAASPDSMLQLFVPEHALRTGYRLVGFEAVADAPPIPADLRPLGAAYVVREAAEEFLREAVLLMRVPAAARSEPSLGRAAIYGYAPERETWESLPTFFCAMDSRFRAVVGHLHAYYLVADRNALIPADGPPPQIRIGTGDGCSNVGARLIDDGISTSPRGDAAKTMVDQHEVATTPDGPPNGDAAQELVHQTFEAGTDTWRNLRGPFGALIERVARGDDHALKLTDERGGGSFGVRVLDAPFDAAAYPIVEFDYRIAAGVKTDFYVKVEGRWYDIGFTDDPNDLAYRRVNIGSAGRIDGIITDGQWHHARFNLWDMLRTRTGEHIVERIEMADWNVPGMMRLDFGTNAAGAAYWIDNFTIRRDDAHEPPPHQDVLLVDDFNGSGDTNLLGGPVDVFTDGGAGWMRPEIRDDEVLGRSLRLEYDVDGPGRFAGYVTGLPDLDVRDRRVLSLTTRGGADVSEVLVGVRDAAGNESKVRLGNFTQLGLPDDVGRIAIPLVAFGETIDWSDLVHISLSVAAPASRNGAFMIDDIRFERTLESVVIDRFDGQPDTNLLGGGRYAHMSDEAVSRAEIVEDRGNPNLRIVYGGAIPWGWAAWRSNLRGLDCSRCSEIRFRIRGAHGGERPNLYLDDGNHRWPVDVERYGVVTTEWTEVAIPLADFAAEGVDLTHLVALELVFEWEPMSGAIYADDIRFGSNRDKPPR